MTVVINGSTGIDTGTGALINADATTAAYVRLFEDTDNGSNYIDIIAPAAVASNRTITLPDVTGTMVTTGDSGSVTSTMLAAAVQPIGVGQTWTNVTGSRATGTTYTNSTGRPIMVVVSPVASGSLIGTFNIGGSSVGVVQFTPSGGGGGSPFFYIIPNGITYSVTNNSNFSISTWWELR